MTNKPPIDNIPELSQEEQAATYRALVESMNDGFGIINEEGIFTYVNLRFARILGYRPDEMVGKRTIDFLDDENKRIIRDNIRRRTEGHATQYELSWKKKVGGLVPTIVSGTPLFNGDGKHKGSFAVVTDITEIKQSRKALEESTEMLQRIFNESQLGILLFDTKGILTNANEAALKIFAAQDIENIKGLSIFDDPNIPREIKADLIRGKQVKFEVEFNFEKALVKSNRSGTIIIDAFITPLGLGNDGDLKGYLCQVFEKTEFRKTEAALEDTERRYQLLAENVTDVIFTTDLELNLTYVSSSVELLSGHTAEELIGTSMIELLTPESVWTAIEAIKQALEEEQIADQTLTRGESPSLQLRLKRKDGTIIWIETTRTFMRNDSKKPTGVLGVARNIEERKVAEEALINSEQKYRTLVDQSLQGIMIIHASPLSVLFTNPAFAGFLNRSVDEVLGLSPEEIQSLIHPEDLPVVLNRLQELMMGDIPGSIPMAIRVFQKDGTMQWLEMFGRRIQYEEKAALQLVALNVTDRINAEKHLQTQKERAMLYLDLMSHDFRNQLQIILGSTMVMEMSLQNPEARRILGQITSAVERCQSMISKVKVTEPLMVVPLKPRKLRTALESVLTQMMDQYRDVDIAVILKTDTAIIEADQFLEQLLGNLIENAIEHNPKSERRVWVVLEKSGEGFDISVADNGSGISDALKVAIFDISRRYGGVGLHQSKQICDKYGGRISVRDRVPNQPSQGAEFVVWFPAHQNSNQQ
ncbi:PAS domain-containing sensor histidine kinase [Candidatus Thorarchaeota archaeon]|nr:MAG: PAS domain-containing sensor histidine kinase [Candidatus Thorarchaeota archaeon]